jgi:hypothetical protein
MLLCTEQRALYLLFCEQFENNLNSSWRVAVCVCVFFFFVVCEIKREALFIYTL